MFVKLNGNPEQAKVMCIRSTEQLDNLCNHQIKSRSHVHDSEHIVNKQFYFLYVIFVFSFLSLCFVLTLITNMSDNINDFRYIGCLNLDQNLTEYEQVIDPEHNLFKNINTTYCYYTEKQFNKNITVEHGISIIHFNSRSLYTNFQSIKEYLTQLQPSQKHF